MSAQYLLSILRDAGIAAGALVAIVAAFKLIPGIDKPIRYLFRVLIGDPLSAWAHSVVMPIVTEALEPVSRRLDSIDGAVKQPAAGVADVEPGRGGGSPAGHEDRGAADG